MRIPPVVAVGAMRYSTTEDYDFNERHDLYGQVNHSQLTIRLSGMDSCGHLLPRAVVEQSWWHEIMHAIDVVFNANGGKLSDEDVERLAHGVHQVVDQVLAAQGPCASR
jgi:hypothetical protein